MAVATGAVSGLVVLDVDRHGAVDGFTGLSALLGDADMPETLTVSTGGGGKHFYFTHPGSEVQAVAIPGVGDLKFDGGYVVAPPSQHLSGREYAFENASTEPAPYPTVLGTKIKGVVPSRIFRGSTIPVGERNRTLTRVAGAMRGQGCVAEEILVALQEVNLNRCAEPLSSAEVEGIARSIGRRPESRTYFNGGTFWERDITRQLHPHPREKRLLDYLVTEAAWADSLGAMAGVEAGTLNTTYRKIQDACAWQENNAQRAWSLSEITRLLERLAAWGYITVTPTELGTRVEVLNYARFKGYSASLL